MLSGKNGKGKQFVILNYLTVFSGYFLSPSPTFQDNDESTPFFAGRGVFEEFVEMPKAYSCTHPSVLAKQEGKGGFAQSPIGFATNLPAQAGG